MNRGRAAEILARNPPSFARVIDLMKPLRTTLRPIASFALALLLCWVAVGVIHQHSEDPTCEICKLLHGSVAAMGIAAANIQPASICERLSAAPADKPAQTTPSSYPVRGPPLS